MSSTYKRCTWQKAGGGGGSCLTFNSLLTSVCVNRILDYPPSSLCPLPFSGLGSNCQGISTKWVIFSLSEAEDSLLLLPLPLKCTILLLKAARTAGCEAWPGQVRSVKVGSNCRRKCWCFWLAVQGWMSQQGVVCRDGSGNTKMLFLGCKMSHTLVLTKDESGS